jgi:hypothetical protein
MIIKASLIDLLFFIDYLAYKIMYIRTELLDADVEQVKF